MTAQTSIQALRDIRAEGLPQRQHEQIMAYLRTMGCASAGEIEAGTGCKAHKRMIELAKSGLVNEVGVRRCAVSGRMAKVWGLVEDAVQLSLWGKK